MKRNLIAIIALLTVGMVTAQSKKSLMQEFENLEKQIEKVNTTYEAKLTVLEKEIETEQENLANKPITDEDLKGFKEFEMNTGTEDVMRSFIEMYEGSLKAEEADSFKDVDAEENQSEKKKKYLAVLKELNTKTLSIEKKMYDVAKKYFSKN